MVRPTTLSRDVSPPPSRRTTSTVVKPKASNPSSPDGERHAEAMIDGPSLAAIESGVAQIRDHLEYFSHRLSAVSRPLLPKAPRISMAEFQALYKRNIHPNGHHFVVHQHDHPISGRALAALFPGVHYDLRLQFSETSTISFAIPYGLPGNSNSIRPNRMAIETRVHNLWNNLIESASHATGSLLIWDTGEYEILPYRNEHREKTTDDELSDDGGHQRDSRSNSERIVEAFQARHIRLRLHGKRLPRHYTISLRLPTANSSSRQPRKPKYKRRKLDPSVAKRRKELDVTESEGDDTSVATDDLAVLDVDRDDAAGMASEAEEEDAIVRANNAYKGATNTIGSVHQRHWFVTLDRQNSGFAKSREPPDEGRWLGAWEPFYVHGRDVERSVVTGRLAEDVMKDADVRQFVGRKMWRPITE